MADQELAEVDRNSSDHQVEEDNATGVLLVDADWQLVGEAADDLVAPSTERDVRVLLVSKACSAGVEERPLVFRRAQPPASAIAEHGVENHDPLDHSADRVLAAIAVIWKPNRLVERLVVHVVQAPSPDGSRLNGSGESARDQAGHELAAVLAANGACVRAVLPLQETAGVDHDGGEELALALGEAEPGKGVHASFAHAVECRIARVFVHQRKSSMMRGCGRERPPLPRDATT
jgi:hypothetical protein